MDLFSWRSLTNLVAMCLRGNGASFSHEVKMKCWRNYTGDILGNVFSVIKKNTKEETLSSSFCTSLAGDTPGPIWVNLG